jgi:hypothetical protein
MWHWVDGGPTDLDNLVLLCRAHHRAVHEGGWQLTANPTGASPPPHPIDHSDDTRPRRPDRRDVDRTAGRRALAGREATGQPPYGRHGRRQVALVAAGAPTGDSHAS